MTVERNVVTSNEVNMNISVNELNREIHPRNGLFYRFNKRLFDIVASFLFLVLFGWFILLLLLIKFLEDGHNPIYTSKRVGIHGKIIKFHKIRTMIPNADKLKQKLIDEGKNEVDGPVFKIKNDPRLTKVGKFYRKFSLDELLQIWDILFNRLSVVGPRPPLPDEVKQYDAYQYHRLDVKGGILCLWQIQKNRHDLTFNDWVDLDIKYIESRNLWLDFKIIMKGAWMVLFDHSGE